MNVRIPDLKIESARIIFRNFAGAEKKNNPSGKRNFCVLLDKDSADGLVNDGWNVKVLNPRDDQEEPQPFLQVAVSYTNVPPKIWMVTSTKKTLLSEETIDMLDYAEIDNVDLVISPYQWEMNGRTGVKAYVKNMYVTIKEDEFDRKYSDIPGEDEVPFN